MTRPRIILLLFALWPEARLLAQADLLPKGLGMFQWRHREYRNMNSYYTSSGESKPIGSKLDKDFSGQELQETAKGTELEKLLEELNTFSGGDANNPINQLNLGQLQGNINSNISADFFGFAYGVSDRANIIVGAPYVRAKVTSSLQMNGQNNAAQIKEKLGEAAYEELKVGLDRAAAFNIDSVRNSIDEKEYSLPETWSKAGIGDTLLGVSSGRNFNPARGALYGFTIAPILTIPTGYAEDPSILSDVGIGKGYYSMSLMGAQKISFYRRLFLVNGMEYKFNMPTRKKVRVPEENESLVDPDRTTTAMYNPGDEYDVNLGGGIFLWHFNIGYVAGQKRHYSDQYSGGTVDGNYGELSKDSASLQQYEEYKLTFDGISAYRNKQFFYPCRMELVSHQILKATNAYSENYFEFRFTGLFSTPAYSAKETKSR